MQCGQALCRKVGGLWRRPRTFTTASSYRRIRAESMTADVDVTELMVQGDLCLLLTGKKQFIAITDRAPARASKPHGYRRQHGNIHLFDRETEKDIR